MVPPTDRTGPHRTVRRGAIAAVAYVLFLVAALHPASLSTVGPTLFFLLGPVGILLWLWARAGPGGPSRLR
jgi:hypothetical protein